MLISSLGMIYLGSLLFPMGRSLGGNIALGRYKRAFLSSFRPSLLPSSGSSLLLNSQLQAFSLMPSTDIANANGAEVDIRGSHKNAQTRCLKRLLDTIHILRATLILS